MIKRIEILNYKGFEYVDISPDSYNVLIGPNASGKSSFIEILNLLKDIIIDDAVPAIERNCARFDELVHNYNLNKLQFEVALEFELPDDVNQEYQLARYEIALSQDEREGIIIKYENIFLKNKGKHLNNNTISNLQHEARIPDFIVNPFGKMENEYNIIGTNDLLKSKSIFVKSNKNHGVFYSSVSAINELHSRPSRPFRSSGLNYISETFCDPAIMLVKKF